MYNEIRCANIHHGLSWKVTGAVSPCNNLINFPEYFSVTDLHASPEYHSLCNGTLEYCVRCLDKEKLNLTSKRIADNKTHAVYHKINPEYIKIDGAIGSTCNAGCRICNSNSSTWWQNEDQKFNKLVNIKKSQLTIWDYIESNKDNIIQLDLGGGEPWLNNIEKQIELLDYWIKNNKSKFIKIRYNTNASLTPKTLIDKFKFFREVRLTVSIDDTHDRFEYNRYPLKWQAIEKNIKYLKSIPNVVLDVNYTVSIFTFLYVTQFEQYCYEHLNLTNINWNVLQEPSVFSIKSLPADLRNKCANNKFAPIIGQNEYISWKEEFLTLVGSIDKRRNQQFKDTFPELTNLLNI